MYMSSDPVAVGTKANKNPTYTQLLDNQKWLRDQDAKQAAGQIGTILGEGIGIAINAAVSVQLTNPLLIPTNDFEQSTWMLWAFAELERSAGAAGQFTFDIVPSGHASVLFNNGATFSFALSETIGGTFARAFSVVTVAQSAAAQFYLRGIRDSGAGTINVFRAWQMAARIG